LTRTLPTLALALAATALLAPRIGAASPCEDARDALRHEMSAAGGAMTLDVAHALKAAVDACPADAAPTAAPSSDPPGAPPGKVNLPGLLASQCGFTQTMTAYQPDADFTVWRQAGFDSTPTYEKGWAEVTYTPALDLTSFEGRGSVYGLLAQSDGTGVVYVLGVPVTATRAFAASGCPVGGGPLCWGIASAEIILTQLVAIRVEGRLHVC
jgi:hypothetical protein